MFTKHTIRTTLILLATLALQAFQPAIGQAATQTIRGTIIDQQSKNPLAYVTVEVANSSLAATSDSTGNFVIQNVPAGRVKLLFSLVGYEPQQLGNVVIEAGKETVITAELLESLHKMQDVTVIARREKITDKQMATVSATEFNAEDSRRFAGSRNDVARMAANFAGASSNNDGRNDIIIRGNSPTGLLWRLEGVDIPNPNHYGGLGATGGPVSMINNNVLGKSAFYTGAFPAVYGNATAGVFDLQMRDGNANRREFTGQVGFNGLELGAEGPFNKTSKASYLIYYRYSIPGLLKGLGLNLGTGVAVPYYQDLSFKINLPTKNIGKFTFFGIGGTSHIDFKGDLKDTANFYNDPYSNLYHGTKTGVAGLSHMYFFNSSTSSKITIAATGANVTTRVDSLDAHRLPHPSYRQNGNEWKYVISAVLNKKFSAKDRLTTGITLDQLHYSYNDSVLDGDYGFIPIQQEKNSTELLRGYAQWQHRFSDKLVLNTGVYTQWLALNNSFSSEGRVGAKYNIGKGALSLAYGEHSQMQTLMTYFLDTKVGDKYVQTNRELGFTKSRHIVAGWEQTLRSGWRYKLEAYTQLLNNVPVESNPSDWSALNAGADYGDSRRDSLVNKGKGYNYGIELTVEKPFANGFYLLATTSVFQSKYKGSNGVSHNTAFNGTYVVNLLGGKEWTVKASHTIGVDIKLTAAGGKRYTPINLGESITSNKTIFYDDHAFENRLSDYLRADIKLTYRMNNKSFMQEFYIDFQNATNHKNMFRQWYDNRTQFIRKQYQLGFYPNFNYRIQF